MKQLFESIAIAFSMYSKVPMPHFEWTKENMRYPLAFFPVVGIVIGAITLVWEWLVCKLGFSPVLGAAVYILIPVLVSGGIHLDGLLDTADALSSWQPKERRLEILKDSHAGAFAIITCVCYFVVTFGFAYEMSCTGMFCGLEGLGISCKTGYAGFTVMALGFALSRALSGIGISTFTCARDSGLARTFADGADKKKVRTILIVEALIIIVLMMLVNVVMGAFTAVAAIITFFACRKLAYDKFGGTTGDIQGFFLQICELVMLIVVVVCQYIL